MIKSIEAEINNLHIGQKAEFLEIISESRVQEFAKLSGDFNPHHMDEEYAKKTKYEKRICHGMLLASFFSKLTAMYLPGQGSFYLSQTLNFVSPAFINDEVTVRGEITKISSSTGIVRVKTQIINKNNVLLVSGDAKVLIP
jgi:3-hydroxybutyryl-CoA dehydratase